MKGYLIIIGLIMGIWFASDHFNLSQYLSELSTQTRQRLKKDIELGSAAERIALNEREVQHLNARLNVLHRSCPALLVLPLATSAPMIARAQLTARMLATAQRGLRAATRAQVTLLRLQGYRVAPRFSSRRESNPCLIEGPLKSNPPLLLSAHDRNSGVQILQNDRVEWQFHVAGSERPWF